jgi:hypothetical protein
LWLGILADNSLFHHTKHIHLFLHHAPFHHGCSRLEDDWSSLRLDGGVIVVDSTVGASLQWSSSPRVVMVMIVVV